MPTASRVRERAALEAVGFLGIEGRVQLFRFWSALGKRDDGHAKKDDEPHEGDRLNLTTRDEGQNAQHDRDPVYKQHRLSVREAHIEQAVVEVTAIRRER